MSPAARQRRFTRLALALWLACCGVAASAGERGEDERRAARSAIEQRYQQAVQDCLARFAVNACQQEARLARQQALQPLLDEELAESLAQREQRASESRQRLREKAQEQAQLEARRRSEALMAAPPLPRAEAAQPASAASRPARPVPDVEKLRRQDEAAAAQRARDQQSRIRKAEAHRREALERLQDRALHKPLAPPLPPPSAASAPR
ncbi:hypothetical protein [Pelomonas sp. BJYL3]|uniref:hypothetical protein n=1 Tax=Pelomonas sp. BJYL3 TaxID=2976697 RepID=UPI0022B4DCAB|nr:hypothetical protein [Pelomonas sp. BJYL3]